MKYLIRLPHRALLVVACSLLMAVDPAAAQPVSRDKIPEPLRPWIDWVLHGKEDARCPFFQGSAERRQCVWPSRLDLDLGDASGRFTQQWLMYKETWVPLPGDAKVWPQEVRVNGQPAVITAQGENPSIRLPGGRHTVSGSFAWDKLPSLLQVPRETGLLSLSVRARPVRFPVRDEQGRVWLEKSAEAETAEDRLDLSVHRRVEDDIPLLLTTQVELRVSGKGREELLGRALPDGFVPLSLRSPLPARLEPDGRLRVQVRPGRWMVDLVARREGPAATLALPAPGGAWDSEEVWVFDARPHLRLVAVEGVATIDPQQTTLPDAWKALPAYLMTPGTTMTLAEKRRGDSDPPPDELTLHRTWWLDFNGAGYTIQDRISGRMERGWRLEMPPPASLGRVAVNGQEQFITRLGGAGAAGVELRQGQVEVSADSRIDGATSGVPAVGWAHDFHQVSGVLNLPPGWRLFHVAGVDDVSQTWISSWTLLDFFLVLILTLSVAKLWGRRWAALALAALVLSWIEPGAPRWVWVFLLASEALRRAFTSGRARQLLDVCRLLSIAAMVIIAVPFMVQQVRMALYPALEQPVDGAGAFRMSQLAEARKATVRASRLDKGTEVQIEEAVPEGAEGEAAPIPAAAQAMHSQTGRTLAVQERTLMETEMRPRMPKAVSLVSHDPRAVLQTGPGLPDWSWRAVSLSWQGPVQASQRLRLILVPPSLNCFLAFLRVALVALLALCTFGVTAGALPSAARDFLGRLGLARLLRLGALLAALASALGPGALLVAAGGVAARAADFPSNDLLDALRERLLKPPDCGASCASSPRLALEVGAATLQARMEVHAAANVAIPLPGGAGQWLPERVLLDGAPAPGLVRTAEGRLWLEVPVGSHQVLMEGPLPDRETVQVPLPLKPRRVTVRTEGWRIEGLHEDGVVEDSLQLTRLRGREAGTARILEAGNLPPFVRVVRELSLGLKWEATTQVLRMTPAGSAILVEVPLLAGESVTSADVRVVKGKALVSMGPQTHQMSWVSALEESPAIELRAPDKIPWVEVWKVAASPVWHLEVGGIPVIHAPERGDVREREWRPWPGESVKINITRPEGLAGQTLTIDRAALALSPGLRATDARLSLTLRSSRGGQHVVTLPEGAQLQAVSINGGAQPIRQDGREVTLPLAPGVQAAEMTWRQDRGIGLCFRAPEVRAGAASVNAQVTIQMPADRWTLFLRGPRLGPAVLFWSILIVAGLISAGLGQLRVTPLRWRHWFLLSLGLTQVPIWMAAFIVAWILALGWRKERGPAVKSGQLFDFCQVILVCWTLFALAGLFWAIEHGLLGFPEMQIAGNGSSSSQLQWYLDRAGDILPRPWVFSLPLMAYRLAMLAWALWLAQALLAWLRWGWGCFSEGGLWRPVYPRIEPPDLQPTAKSA